MGSWSVLEATLQPSNDAELAAAVEEQCAAPWDRVIADPNRAMVRDHLQPSNTRQPFAAYVGAGNADVRSSRCFIGVPGHRLDGDLLG